jgi:hypothetical protein
MSERLSPAAHAVLCSAWCEGNVIKLPPDQLERAVYEEVNEVIQRLGGQWKTKKGHVFSFYDPAPLLAGIQSCGLMPPKNPTAFFPTPRAIIQDMLKTIDYLPDTPRILEPSAGAGAIADALRAKYSDAEIDCCELLDLNRAILEQKGYTVVCEDFLDWQPGAVYDAIVMNPPFSVKADKTAWATHLLHAWSLLKEDGYLVCITPAAIEFRDDAAHRELRYLVAQYGGFEPIPAGAFKGSGTGVATCMVWLRRADQSWRDRPHQGWPNYHQWLLFLHIDNTREDTDKWQELIDTRADDSAVLAFLGGVVERARKAGDWIAWDTEQQQIARAEFCKLAGKEPTIEQTTLFKVAA